MTVTAGIDVGSGAVKVVLMRCEEGSEQLLSKVSARIRRRHVPAVIEETFDATVAAAGVETIDYIGTTGEGEEVPFATGHFYGMTTHARGGLFLAPEARAVLDVGALHSRAVLMDERGKVLSYKMTSQCASGSGQFLENIARYLGVSAAEVGELSRSAAAPEKVSSICAVLAETDVINMVSRGISTADILRGIHESMAFRFARLLRSVGAEGVALVTGGLAQDSGLRAALQDALDADLPGAAGGAKRPRRAREAKPLEIKAHPDSIFAGAIGAAIWGAFRYTRLDLGAPAWRSGMTAASASSQFAS
ncbi:MAG: benzoyl-CoA reductase subunit D [Myxococcales bacterium]|nr:benzoyl-CoA reductase subunit D [Myxococcales bacterium]